MTYENRIAETLGIAAEDGVYAIVVDGRVAVVISYSKADAETFTGPRRAEPLFRLLPRWKTHGER